MRFQVALVLAQSASAWLWHVKLRNTGTGTTSVDLIYAQDLALAHTKPAPGRRVVRFVCTGSPAENVHRSAIGVGALIGLPIRHFSSRRARRSKAR